MANLILTVDAMVAEAERFAVSQSSARIPELFGATDGKAVGTYIEKAFKAHLASRFTFDDGNSAKGIDFPELGVDVKVTSEKQPQSSSPFKSARQKIFGLGYSLLVFVYEKSDDPKTKTAILEMRHTIFIDGSRTADFQTTTGLQQILENNGNTDDLVAFMRDRNLPIDDIEATAIAEELLKLGKLEIGYLTISNALQWRLQYSRAIEKAGAISGIRRIQ